MTRLGAMLVFACAIALLWSASLHITAFLRVDSKSVPSYVLATKVCSITIFAISLLRLRRRSTRRTIKRAFVQPKAGTVPISIGILVLATGIYTGITFLSNTITRYHYGTPVMGSSP